MKLNSITSTHPKIKEHAVSQKTTAINIYLAQGCGYHQEGPKTVGLPPFPLPLSSGRPLDSRQLKDGPQWEVEAKRVLWENRTEGQRLDVEGRALALE